METSLTIRQQTHVLFMLTEMKEKNNVSTILL